MGKFLGPNSQKYSSTFLVLENWFRRFPKFIYRKLSVGYFVAVAGICRKLTLSLLVIAVGLPACATMQERSWQLSVGMTQEEAIAVMGTPDQKLPSRLMYQVKYICTEVPFYLHFDYMRLVKYGVSQSVADAATRDCARDENQRNLRRARADKAAEMLGQVQFGSKPTDFSKRVEPLMQNCWMDSAGWHCL